MPPSPDVRTGADQGARRDPKLDGTSNSTVTLPSEPATAQATGIGKMALDACAARIRALKKSTVENVIEIGKELIIAKAQLGHGRFGKWLEAEVTMSERTAERFVRAADWAGWAKVKSDSLSDLDVTSVYLLSAPSTPASATSKVLTGMERGHRMTVEAVEAIVSQAVAETKTTKSKTPPAHIAPASPPAPSASAPAEPRRPPQLDLRPDSVVVATSTEATANPITTSDMAAPAPASTTTEIDPEKIIPDFLDHRPQQQPIEHHRCCCPLCVGAHADPDPAPLIEETIPPSKRRSRSARWADAAERAVAALEELRDMQGDFLCWQESLPENLQENGPMAEKLRTIIDIDLESAIQIATEAQDADVPLGFGRD